MTQTTLNTWIILEAQKRSVPKKTLTEQILWDWMNENAPVPYEIVGEPTPAQTDRR